MSDILLLRTWGSPPADYCRLRLSWDTRPDGARVEHARRVQGQRVRQPEPYEGATQRVTWEQTRRSDT